MFSVGQVCEGARHPGSWIIQPGNTVLVLSMAIHLAFPSNGNLSSEVSLHYK